jgi:hypothetical protein
VLVAAVDGISSKVGVNFCAFAVNIGQNPRGLFVNFTAMGFLEVFLF